MKDNSKKSQLLKKALDSLKKQALRDEQCQQLKGGDGSLDPTGGGHTAGFIPPEHEL